MPSWIGERETQEMSETVRKPRVLVTGRWTEEAAQAMAERFGASFNPDGKPMSRAALASALDEYDVLCTSHSNIVDGDMLAGAKRTKLIANYGVGYDHIDIVAARERGIAVTNTPDVLNDATADTAFMLMLMVARRAGEAERELRAGRWRGSGPDELLGSSPQGKTLGLVGLGRIGIAAARRAFHGFGMKIAYHSRRPADPAITKELDATFYPDLTGLLGASDFVSLHVPGGEGTTNLIDAQAIAAMKPSAYLINTARGSVVDHDALAAALRDGRIAGAGLDVYPDEPNVPSALLDLENVVLLPHLGSATVETRTAMGLRVLANVEAWAEGNHLPNEVT